MPQLPYMNSTGLVPKIFEKIATAQKPDRFTTDFLSTVLGFSSGSARPVIPLLKRLTFLQSDGTPTQLYTRYRNPSERASAMLEALRTGYSDLYARNEYVHTLPRDRLRDLIVEVTGLEKDNQIVIAAVSTFQGLKSVAGVDAATGATPNVASNGHHVGKTPVVPVDVPYRPEQGNQDIGLNLSYTINLNLPPSTDPEVFNAIFKALKEHLLGR
jgi:hypothetical protein